MENNEFAEKSEVAYNGSDKTPNVSVGEYKGLTYYSQVDTRWANRKYGDSTIGKAGCGPTAAAIVVSSIKGEYLPTQMSDLYYKYGYKCPGSGTYWTAMKWTADVFDIEYSETTSFNKMIDKLENNNYVIAICREGLFTYGGHFIVIVGVDGNNLKIYDPYLYSGKFTTASRKPANVKVSGNTVTVSKTNFKKYANAQKYFCYYNDRTDTKVNESTSTSTTVGSSSSVKNVDYKVKVTAKAGLNIRKGASTSYSKVGAYAYNTKVSITKESGNWGYTGKGWICLDYTSKISTSSTSYKTGTYKITASLLNVRSGPSTSYSKKTYKQLSSNARSQNRELGNYYANGYLKGVTCTVSKVNGNWGLTPSGWICLDYTNKGSSTSSSTATKTVNAKLGLVLRKTAGTSGARILAIPYGNKVSVIISNYTTKNGYTWSKVKYGNYTGYVASKYLK